MKGKITGILLLIVGLIQALGLKFVFGACGPKEDGKWMRCHYTETVGIAIGILVVFVGIVYIATSSKALIGAGLSLALIPVGIISILLPHKLIGVCMKETMKCVAVTSPAITVLGAIIVIIAVVSAVINLKAGYSADANKRQSIGA